MSRASELIEAAYAYAEHEGVSVRRLAAEMGLSANQLSTSRQRMSASAATCRSIKRFLDAAWPDGLERPRVLDPARRASQSGLHTRRVGTLWYVYDGNRRVSGGGAASFAEERLEALRRESRRRERPCITCRATFRSEGPHNRMCSLCRNSRSRVEYEVAT